MDAFYAAVEQRDRPELRGKPVVVGADPQGGSGRGVVSTASYEARKFGIGSAMPISQAWKRCPTAVFVRPDMERYGAVSKQVFAILRRFSDCVEPVSIDEAFLDLTHRLAVRVEGEELKNGPRAAGLIKAAIRRETGLTASVGVATSKMVAKVASDMRKPDGLVVVAPGSEAAFLAPLPVRRLWGVGPKMEEELARLGITTIGALAAVDPARLERRLGTHGHDLQQLARGEDDREVHSEGEGAKSIGQETTFDHDTGDLAVLRRTVLGLADAVARRLREHGTRARTITLKYRDETFRTITRAETVAAPIDTGGALFEVAWRLFGVAHGRRRVRLLGIYASSLGEPAQRGLFAAEPSAADRVRDAVDERFGEGSLTRASLLRGRPGDVAPDLGDRKGSRRLPK
jgi:nucleotidyltransferase/DNA polymerase involved in DNA repair